MEVTHVPQKHKLHLSIAPPDQINRDTRRRYLFIWKFCINFDSIAGNVRFHYSLYNPFTVANCH